MFQIENEVDRVIVQEELAAWQAEKRRLLLRIDAQMSMKEALGRCNEEAMGRFTQGLEECAFQIKYFEGILAAAPPSAEAQRQPSGNGVHT